MELEDSQALWVCGLDLAAVAPLIGLALRNLRVCGSWLISILHLVGRWSWKTLRPCGFVGVGGLLLPVWLEARVGVALGLTHPKEVMLFVW